MFYYWILPPPRVFSKDTVGMCPWLNRKKKLTLYVLVSMNEHINLWYFVEGFNNPCTNKSDYCRLPWGFCSSAESVSDSKCVFRTLIRLPPWVNFISTGGKRKGRGFINHLVLFDVGPATKKYSLLSYIQRFRDRFTSLYYPIFSFVRVCFFPSFFYPRSLVSVFG